MTSKRKTSDKKPLFPDEFLEECIKLYRSRDREYGSVWRNQGKVIKQFFPDGIELRTEEDFEKFHLFNTLIMKMKRIAENLKRDCHPDSSMDAIVYHSFLLSYLEETDGKEECDCDGDFCRCRVSSGELAV